MSGLQQPKTSSSVASELRDEVVQAHKNPRRVYGYFHFGHYEQDPEHVGPKDEWVLLDRLTHGGQKKRMVALFARPKKGKSRFIAGLLPNVAEQVPQGQVIRVFTFEMSAKTWTKVSAAAIAAIPDPTKIDTGELTQEELERYNVALDYVETLPIELYDEALDYYGIEALVRVKKDENRPKTFLWVLDNFGLVKQNGYGRDEKNGSVALANDLQWLCQHVCTGIIIGHLTRMSAGTVPTLESIALTDQISRNVDDAFFIHRVWDGYDRPEGLLDDGEPVMLIYQSRHTQGGLVWLWWDSKLANFRELTSEEIQEIPRPPRKKQRG